MKAERRRKKINVARLSIVSNSLLILLKAIVGIYTGSVSIISESIHSFMDLLAAIVAFFSVRMSGNPPDRRHPYGHGKIENLSGVIEALLIFVAAIWIIYEAIDKIRYPQPVDFIEWGALVMFISALVNIFVSRKLYKVAKETDSIALEADALHLKTDVYTSLGVSIGLFLLWVTGIHILDPLIAILVALFILMEAFSLLKKALLPMIDEAWPQKELDTLKEELDSMYISYHDVRTRKAGSYRFLDIHISVPSTESVVESHELCDKIEKRLMITFPDITVSIHVEPAR